MISYNEIRRTMYETQFARWSDYININSPYTYIKAIYYMEFAVIFLFLTQTIITSPNFITLIYIFTGVLGAFLINSIDITWQIIGLVLIFSKGIFDWADGPLARRLGKTSFIGYSLDGYGAFLSDIAFRLAFIYYTLLQNEEYMYLFPFIAFLISIVNFKSYSDALYLKMDKKDNTKDIEDNTKLKDGKLRKIFDLYMSFLDDRARSIDSLLLLILIDILYDFDLSYILLLLSFLIIIRSIVQHIGFIYLTNKTYDKK